MLRHAAQDTQRRGARRGGHGSAEPARRPGSRLPAAQALAAIARRLSGCTSTSSRQRPSPQATRTPSAGDRGDDAGIGGRRRGRERPRPQDLEQAAVVGREGSRPGREAAHAPRQDLGAAASSRAVRPPCAGCGASVACAWSCGCRLQRAARRGRPRVSSRSSRARAARAAARARPAVSSAPIARLRAQERRAGVEALVDQHRRDAGLGLAAGDRPLDRRRAAVAWQQRGVDVHGAERREVDHGAGQDLAEGDDDLQLGPQRAQLRPVPRARARGGAAAPAGRAAARASLVGGAASAWPRPFSRSGWVTSAATSWPASSSASRLGTAKAPVPMKTTRTR